MAQSADNDREQLEASPGAIREQMARTRAELRAKLETLKTHVLGEVVPQTHGDIMVAKKSTKGAKAKAPAKTPSRKAAAARVSTKKKAGTKAAGAKSATAAAATRSAKKKRAPRRRSSPLVKKAKKVMGEVLAGAAAGAVAGAIEAAIPVERHETASRHAREAESD